MQRLPSTGRAGRPKVTQTSKSFTRFEPQNSSLNTQAKSNFLPDSPVLSPSGTISSIPPTIAPLETDNDIFERHEHDEGSDDLDDSVPIAASAAPTDLPVEIQSMVESFLESLGAKVHATPLSINKLSQLFQDFYEHAYDNINGHIAFLATRSPIEQSPTPSISSSGSAPSAARARINSKPVRPGSKTRSISTDQQMLTPSEIAGRRKSRRMLEQKRGAMEEAVERTLCEKVYPRIWQHRSTDDEERDEKVRSRAAALALVGVDLRELLSTAMGNEDGSASQLQLKENADSSARTRLNGARESLQRMNDDKYPLGKLVHLKAVHKSIVEMLQQISASSSSADEVLPTLIYTIITADPNSNHVVSNFNFIQRFRAASKIDGEAAYCLTNLEAAITFLETVDLSLLRSDELPEGPSRALSQPSTPGTDTPDPMYRGFPEVSSDIHQSIERLPTLPPSSQSRGLSVLTQPRQKAFDLQSDVVLKKADEAFDTIHSALEGSFKFLFGRLRERQGSSSAQNGETAVAKPRTLEDARKLVSPSAPVEDEDSLGDGSSVEQSDEPPTPAIHLDKGEDSSNRMLQMIGGRRTRGNSLESGKSGDSASRKVSLGDSGSPPASISGRIAQVVTKSAGGKVKGDDSTQTTSSTLLTSPLIPGVASASAPAYAAVESMRNLGTTLNPLRGLAGMGMMRSFGRNVSSSASTPPAASAHSPSPLEQAGAAVKDREHIQEPQITTKEKFDVLGVAPPVQRFIDCKEARGLTGFEVELLLRDYQRLAGVLRALRESEQIGS